MSLIVLEAVEETNRNIPIALKPAIVGSVTRAAQNYSEITGVNRNRNFFYREAAKDDYRLSLFQRMFAFYCSFAFASRTSGDLIEREMKSWFDLRASLQDGQASPIGNIWDVQEQVDAQLNALRSAIISGSRIEARFMLIQIRRNVDLMLKLCDRDMPSPFMANTFV